MIPSNDNFIVFMNTFYSGDVLPTEAWTSLKTEPNSFLVDVRTSAEWHFVGLPDLTSINKEAVCIEWKELPDMRINPGFALNLTKKISDRNSKIFFICRTGGRSAEAAIAMTNEGYQHCYNIIGGFEGEPDQNNHRGNKIGWKAAALPWEQE